MLERQVPIKLELYLQREAQNHFNCSTLAGVELENQGGPASVLSHWEKRVLGVSVGGRGSGYIISERLKVW